MNIDEKVEQCLKRSHLNISVCYGVCNVLLMAGDDVIKRVRSDRGLEYTVRMLVGTVFEDSDLIAHTESHFPHVVGPVQQCDYIRFLTNAYMTICFVDKQIRIKYHSTGMDGHRDIPGSIFRYASGKTYSEAIKKILHAKPKYSMECVY